MTFLVSSPNVCLSCLYSCQRLKRFFERKNYPLESCLVDRFGKQSVVCFGRNEGIKKLHTTKWFKDPDCSYFVKQSSFWQPDIRQEALQPGSKKKKIKQDHLRRNVAPDRTIILVLQIVLDQRSFTSIGH